MGKVKKLSQYNKNSFNHEQRKRAFKARSRLKCNREGEAFERILQYKINNKRENPI